MYIVLDIDSLDHEFDCNWLSKEYDRLTCPVMIFLELFSKQNSFFLQKSQEIWKTRVYRYIFRKFVSPSAKCLGCLAFSLLNYPTAETSLTTTTFQWLLWYKSLFSLSLYVKGLNSLFQKHQFRIYLIYFDDLMGV